MSSKMEDSLGLPKREIYSSLTQLHSKIDAISASTKLWIQPYNSRRTKSDNETHMVQSIHHIFVKIHILARI